MARRGPKPRRTATIPLIQEWKRPSHLGAVARREFDRIVDLLRQRGALDQTDATLVVRRAELCELAEALYGQLRKDGPVIETDRKNLVPHPAARLLVSTVGQIKSIDEALGLTPSSAMVSAGQKPSDPYAQWRVHLGGR